MERNSQVLDIDRQIEILQLLHSNDLEIVILGLNMVANSPKPLIEYKGELTCEKRYTFIGDGYATFSEFIRGLASYYLHWWIRPVTFSETRFQFTVNNRNTLLKLEKYGKSNN